MKIDRSSFPPLTEADFQCEYYLTAESQAALLEIIQNIPMESWPSVLRPKFLSAERQKRNAKRNCKEPSA